MSKSGHSDDGSSEDTYEVGYGKPPKHSQFKPGQSGNRKGRPKGTRNFKTDVKETLKAPVKVTKNGKPRNVSTQEAALLRLREKALSGDARALDRLIDLARTYNNEDLTAAAGLTASDEAVLEIYRARTLSGAASTNEQIKETDSEEAWQKSGIDDEPDAASDAHQTPEETEQDR